ncbi:MAG: Nif3-like dinuclear metal center hexameric protein [Burkholderiales bacterium]|nr:Nif3-like dinuclear metal center hexameric protein [Burkholderiales bacterium]
MKHRELEDYTGRLLEVDRFRDYCPNGMQVEGARDIEKIATGVTASLAFLEKARDFGADAVFVHHGYFWKGSDPRITGMARKRIALLLESGMSLFAYHLPLDAHPEFGNNARLARVLGFSVQGRFGEQNIAMIGELERPMTLEEFGEAASVKLSRAPLLVGDGKKILRTISWCSGAAQGMLLEAANLGADAFLSGEISEHTVHEALESGIAYISAGHHATERYGISALGEHLSETFGFRHEFIDCDIPV